MRGSKKYRLVKYAQDYGREIKREERRNKSKNQIIEHKPQTLKLVN